MGDTNPYGRKGRHHRLNQQHTKARYHLRAGMSKVALQAKLEGKPAEDSVGRPLLYANELAERHGAAQLARWAKGGDTTTTVVGLFGGMDFRCPACHRLTKTCRCR